MKKIMILAALCCSFAAFAAPAAAPQKNEPAVDIANPVQPPYAQYRDSYLQIGLWYNFPSAQMYSNVYGIKSGWPMCAGRGMICGIEASWLGSLTDYVRGLQASWTICHNREFAGIQASLISCFNRESFYGLQASPVFQMAGDFCGVQTSSVNLSGNFKGFQPAAVMNVSKDFMGFQAAPVLNVAKDFTGVQASFINVAKKIATGLQIGFINVAEEGFQFGFLNFNDNGFLPCFPIVNF